MAINQRLKIFLNHLGLSQTDVANAIGVKPPSINKALSGTTHLSIDSMTKLSEVYKLNLHWLLTGTGPMLLDGDSTYRGAVVNGHGNALGHGSSAMVTVQQADFEKELSVARKQLELMEQLIAEKDKRLALLESHTNSSH